ncbi:MAG: DedA family protein [Bacteroidales bacterium]|nr:DedA family protein [Bacteroidales bacterium]
MAGCSRIEYMADLIIEFLKDYGYLGMGIMAFLAGTVVPITSEVLLVFFLGIGLNAVGLTLAATIGNTLGGVTCFMIGYLTTKEKVQRFFKVPDRRMKRADMLIQKYGYWTAAFSFLPVLGEVFLLSLGIMRVNRFKVISLMALGKLFRYSLVVISAIGISKFFGF